MRLRLRFRARKRERDKAGVRARQAAPHATRRRGKRREKADEFAATVGANTKACFSASAASVSPVVLFFLALLVGRTETRALSSRLLIAPFPNVWIPPLETMETREKSEPERLALLEHLFGAN